MSENDLEIRKLEKTLDKETLAQYNKQIIDTLNKLLRYMQDDKVSIMLIASIKTENGMESILLNNQRTIDTLQSVMTTIRELNKIKDEIIKDI
jgi:hypothetical protein